MTMRYFLFGLILCVVQQVRCQTPMIDECKKELNWTGDALKINASATQEDKCFIACVLNKNEEIKADGSIDLDKAKAVIDKCPISTPEQKEKRFQAVKECASEVTPTPEKCEAAYKHYMCRKTKMSNP